MVLSRSFDSRFSGWLYLNIFVFLVEVIYLVGLLFFLHTCENRFFCVEELKNLYHLLFSKRSRTSSLGVLIKVLSGVMGSNVSAFVVVSCPRTPSSAEMLGFVAFLGL